MKQSNKKEDLFPCYQELQDVSFLENLVTDIAAIGTSQGGGTIRPGERTIRAVENFK